MLFNFPVLSVRNLIRFLDIDIIWIRSLLVIAVFLCVAIWSPE